MIQFYSILLSLLLSFSINAQTKKEIKVVFVGDSLTAGYGVEREKAFPFLIGEKLKKDGISAKVINGGVSGSTTANALSRMKWFLKSKPEIMMLALGANDGLRGISYESSKENLEKAIKIAEDHQVNIILAGMQLPPNYGKEYREQFKTIFPTLAKKHKLSLIPFLLEGVAAEKELNIEDGIHPNEKGHQKIANLVFPFIKKEIEAVMAQSKQKEEAKK